MSATDELRRMLDERGIEYETACVPHTFHRTEWEAGGSRYEFLEDRYPHATELRVTTRHATPAQAIAATVDAGTCKAVFDKHYYRGINGYGECLKCSECGEPLFSVFRNCPWCGRRIERGGA